jgi:hypothetical protein
MDIKALEKAGFKHDDELKSAHEEQADKNSMHETGPYVVHGVWRKGLVSVLFEQNNAAVCVVSGPKGRAACNPDDTELLLLLVEELA